MISLDRIDELTDGDWVTLLMEIHSMRHLEKKRGTNFLRSDSELQKIWGCPKEIWGHVKWSLFHH